MLLSSRPPFLGGANVRHPAVRRDRRSAIRVIPYDGISDVKIALVPTCTNLFDLIHPFQYVTSLLPSARRAIAMEIDRQKAYAPVKNAPGSKDSTPAAAQAKMVALHSEWLRAAGVEVDDGAEVEISPLFARHADEVPGRVTAGMRITGATYFGSPL